MHGLQLTHRNFLFSNIINKHKNTHMDTQEVNGKAQLWMDEDCVLYFKMLPKTDIRAEDAEEMCKVAASISKDVIHGNLVDISEMTFMDKKARAVFASQEKTTVKGVAIVSSSSIQKSIINLYFNFSKPSIPTKVFSTQADAKKWLVDKMK